jgi:uncharacterized protein YjbJ (UPF0337 family)
VSIDLYQRARVTLSLQLHGGHREYIRILVLIERQSHMDKDRIKGSAQQAKGAVKEVIGKVTGDAKLEAEGKSEKVVGKIQNAVGGLKDTLRGK